MPGMLCRRAIQIEERSRGIPHGLLAAVGRIETGRPDPVSGDVHPWPWSANAEGQGYFFDSKAQAVAAVRAIQSHGIQSIDVGCMQVNLMHHPNAFTSLEEAFDPAANVSYAGRFLTELFAQTGSWTKAAGRYHSATPELGAEYERHVLAAWPDEARQPAVAARTPLAAAWAATLPPQPRSGMIIRNVHGASPAGGPAMGRDLASYRAVPIAMAWRAPSSHRFP